MLARVPWEKPKEKPRRLTKERKVAIREKVVELIRDGMEQGQPSKFWCEGPARAGIRSSLCLQGWKWAEADAVAVEIVAAALNIVGAKRPTWQEGQPEWTQPGALPIKRERCIRCRKPLPEGHWKFCSHLCNTAYNGERRRQRKREEINIAWLASRAAWQAKQPARTCESCGRLFKPRRPKQKLCRPRCGYGA